MSGYPFEIRRYPMKRFDGGLPESPPIYLGSPYDPGYLLERGTIDRATADIRGVLEGQLARLAAEWRHVGPFRLKVQWLRTPRGPYAKRLRNLSVDSLTA